MHPRQLPLVVVAACAMLACTHDTSRGPVEWTATNPSSASGQTGAQAWSRSTSSDTAQPAPVISPTSAGAGAHSAEAARGGEAVQPPRGALLTTGAAVEGTDRVYDSPLSYRQTVVFFDRSLSANGCGYTERSITVTATAWTVRCAAGQTARVTVHDGKPATIEIVEATRRPQQDVGVTSAQP
jgi:hypothetical protein